MKQSKSDKRTEAWLDGQDVSRKEFWETEEEQADRDRAEAAGNEAEDEV